MKREAILSIHLALFFSLFLISIGSAEAAAEKVTLQFENGASYYGGVKNGKPHGKGTMWWGTNKSYSGSWVNGKRSGYGKYVFKDESESDLDETSGQKDNVKETQYIDQDGEIQSGRNMNDLIKQIEPYVKGLNEVFKMI